MDEVETEYVSYEMVLRLVLRLFAMADLAEFTCTAPRQRRAFVLWLFRQAEACTQDFVFDAPATNLSATLAEDDSPAEAMRIAASFRQLAMAMMLALVAAMLWRQGRALSDHRSTIRLLPFTVNVPSPSRGGGGTGWSVGFHRKGRAIKWIPTPNPSPQRGGRFLHRLFQDRRAGASPPPSPLRGGVGVGVPY